MRRGLAGLPPGRRGALIFIVSGMVFVATDSLTKSLVANVPVVDVVFGRHVSYLVALVLLAGRRSPGQLLVTRRLGVQVLRGLAMFGATASFFLALSLLPLAEVSTLASTTPLIVVGLAGPLLGERISGSSVIGAIVGFGGVVGLIGLDPSQLNPAVLIPLGTAASYALFSMLTRELRAEDPSVTMFYSGLIGMIASTILFVAIPATPPDSAHWAGIGLVGLSALVGHRLLVAAYRLGRASDLAPLAYLSLVWSFLTGGLLFHEPAQPRAIAGALAIAAGGAITLRARPAEREPVAASVDYGDSADLEAGSASDQAEANGRLDGHVVAGDSARPGGSRASTRRRPSESTFSADADTQYQLGDHPESG
ncbi:MAG: DMT family transporter [Chloroflexi bacterium]|nr:DMT family transporter [Chloroflexota bacterium]